MFPFVRADKILPVEVFGSPEMLNVLGPESWQKSVSRICDIRRW